jgi:hypothetical protein
MTQKVDMKTFWLGWEVDDSIPEADKLERWPSGMRGWCSGTAANFTIWVARVDAETAMQAEAIVRSCYGASGQKIRMRWEPRSHDLGWRPGDRFPE